jgi:hypothetical protein
MFVTPRRALVAYACGTGAQASMALSLHHLLFKGFTDPSFGTNPGEQRLERSNT